MSEESHFEVSSSSEQVPDPGCRRRRGRGAIAEGWLRIHAAFTQRLDTASADLTDAAHLIDVSLTLLEHPEQLYQRCNDQQRRLLNQAIFHNLYNEDQNITDNDLQEPFGQLHTIQQTQRPTQDAQHTTPAIPKPRHNKKTTRQTDSPYPPSGIAGPTLWPSIRHMF